MKIKSLKILIVLLFLAGILFIGAFAGIMIERTENKYLASKEETVSTIAIVNMDEGISVDGEQYSYSSEVLPQQFDQCVMVGINDALEGITTGKYGAYIVIPSTFSESIESINKNPHAADVHYACNPYLSEETNLMVNAAVNEYLTELNDNISYLYVFEIMKEFHDVQDGAVDIMKNDDADYNNIASINPHKLSENIVFSELTKLENQAEFLDVSEYSGTVKARVDELKGDAKKISDSIATDSNELRNTGNDITDQIQIMSQAIEEFDPLHNADGTSVYDEGVAKVQTAILLNEPEQENAKNAIKEFANLEVDYYAMLQQNYVDTKLAEIEDDNQTYVNNFVSAQNADLEEQYSQIKQNVEEQLAGVPVVWPDAPTITSSCNLKSAKSGLDGDKNPDSNIWINLYENAVSANDISSYSREQIPERGSSLSTQFENKVDDITFNRNTIDEILQKDVIDVVATSVDNGISAITNQCNELNDKFNNYTGKLATIDPSKQFAESGIDEKGNDIQQNIIAMNQKIEEKSRKDYEYVQAVYNTSNDNIHSLEQSMRDANEMTESNVASMVDELKGNRKRLNEENNAILKAFAEKLQYSRLGTLENTDAYDFIVSPTNTIIEISQIDSSRSLKHRFEMLSCISGTIMTLLSVGLFVWYKMLRKGGRIWDINYRRKNSITQPKDSETMSAS